MSAPPERSSLNAARRARELAALPGEVVDVLVVGLGATGAGAALDAASRGLSVAAIDAHDLAFGTSRWSSKLIHGGLRYLASGQLDVAYESAVERGVLLRRTAPHLLGALPFVMPLTPMVPRRQEALVRGGLAAGDALRLAAGTPRSLLPGPRRLTAAETLRLAPALRPDGLRGGLLSWDGRLADDARLVTAIARTAAAHGARILTRCRALTVTGEGALVRDERTGRTFPVRARSVINAAGVWAGGLVDGVRLLPSRGTHLVLRAGSLGGTTAGMQVPVPGSRARFVLVLPQGDGRVYVGLTDEPADGPIPDVPEPTEGEIGFLLDVLGSVLDAPVRRADVAGAFAGLRPLLDDGPAGPGGGPPAGTHADISRRHRVLTSPDGVVTIVGGKLTTYRRMAEDAVDAVLAAGRLGPARPSRTARIPLVGAAPAARPGAGPPVPGGVPARLVRRYGAEAPLLAALAREEGPGSLEPVVPGLPVLGVELAWAVRHEGALDVGDLLDRRTRIGLVPEDRAAAVPAAEAVLRRHAPAPDSRDDPDSSPSSPQL
ncbi:glycerol-3-phosphate dehydrogenase/oxidase [Actinomadura viridis]|uniref:Glycerol-3-phosphate dehydrogenase n=1 Tax=Actinomadura viridis TaxID=58110 RepID=A0A931DK61_9ACTN|nr:glycerol-3-phosphate dehydrogenase/oxidase [Actinomadura viridis]MBG6090937.1 glycerol-3-phosphate dehydrogenase [Actinomadura viridis]